MGYPTYWTDDKEACVKPTGCGDPTVTQYI